MRSALVLVGIIMLVDATAFADCTVERKRARALRDTLASVGDTTPEYRAMLLKKIQDAEISASSCERAEADAKRAADARSAAKQREREAEAKRDAADRFALDEMKSRADFVRKAWSAYECIYEKTRDTLSSNPFATPEQKEELRRAEALLSNIRAAMKRGKLAQLACRAEDVAKLAFCAADSNANAACGQSEMALMVRAERELIEAGQVLPGDAPLTPAQQHAKAEFDDQRIMAPQF